MVSQIILILWSIPIYPPLLAFSQSISPDCESTCGSVEIPYPFGMKDPKCYVDKWFEIECRSSTFPSPSPSPSPPPSSSSSSSSGIDDQKPFLKSINLEVRGIDVDQGKVGIMNPIYRTNCINKDEDGWEAAINMTGSPFVYSQDNKFVSVGCNTIAILRSNGSGVGGCVSICDDNDQTDILTDGCLGRYCCETSLPKYLSEYDATFFSMTERNTRGGSKSSIDIQCNYALIAEQAWLQDRISYEFVPTIVRNLSYVVAVLDWEIVNSTFQIPDTRYCDYSNITSSQKNHSGLTCSCPYEFTGNPYIPDGCQASSDFYSEYYSERKGAKKAIIVGVFSSLGGILLFIGIWFLYKFLRKGRTQKLKQKYFKQNGGLLLQQRVSSGEVNFDRTKLFSLKDLEKATDHFNVNRVLGKGGQGTVYKGMLVDGHIVAVKKFKVNGSVEEFINEALILSQINHRNVVKLLGFCLETKIPLLVYEFIPNGNLFEYLHDQKNQDLPMTWDMRLRIAIEVAGALYYLHSAASQPIYHRDIKSTNILLDEKYRAKVADFGTSRMVTTEDTHLTTLVQGTFGYLDPEYFHTSQFTEKSDVYSFGVVLVELLTGQKPISSARPGEAKSLASYFIMCMEEGRLLDVVDKRISEGGVTEDMVAVAGFAKRCLELNGRKRPTMREVTMQLEGIQKLGKISINNNAQQNHEEMDIAGFEAFQPRLADSTSSTGPLSS